MAVLYIPGYAGDNHFGTWTRIPVGLSPRLGREIRDLVHPDVEERPQCDSLHAPTPQNRAQVLKKKTLRHCLIILRIRWKGQSPSSNIFFLFRLCRFDEDPQPTKKLNWDGRSDLCTSTGRRTGIDPQTFDHRNTTALLSITVVILQYYCCIAMASRIKEAGHTFCCCVSVSGPSEEPAYNNE